MKKSLSVGIISFFILLALLPISLGYNINTIPIKKIPFFIDDNGNPPLEEWNRTYHIPQKTYAIGYCVQITLDGGYIVAGTAGYGYWYDIYLLRIDSDGNELWNQSFGDDGIKQSIDIGRWVEITNDGGYIITGVRQTGYEKHSAWLIKTDENGVESWNKTFGDLCGGYGYCVKQTNVGEYIICCERGLIKTDINGNILWYKTYGGFLARSVTITNDGGFVISGYWQHKLIIIKTDSAGNIEWNKKLPRENIGWWTIGNSVQQTFDDGYIIGGYTDAYGAGETDYWLIKLYNDGVEAWNKTYGDKDWDYGNYGIQIADGGYVIGGQKGTGFDDDHFWLVRTDMYGDPIWTKRYGGEQPGACHCIRQTSDNGYIAIGETDPYTGGKCWIIKIGPDAMNKPPSPPNITGPNSGRIGVEYDFRFVSIDPDGDDIWYYIKWGDEPNRKWDGPYPSGTEITRPYRWLRRGTYTIKAKAMDCYATESNWSEFEIKILLPRPKLWFRDNNIFPINQRILNLFI
jgi:hypothetical protein